MMEWHLSPEIRSLNWTIPFLLSLQVLASTLALSLLISSINAEESKSSSNKNDTITTTLDVSSSSNSSQSLNSTKKESDTREKRNLSGFGSNFYYTNKNNNNNNYYSSVPKAAASTAQRRSSSGGYPFNSNYDFNSLDHNKNINNQKKHLHNNHLTSGPSHDFVKNQLSHGRAKHVIKNNQENGNLFIFIFSLFFMSYRPVFHFPLISNVCLFSKFVCFNPHDHF